MKGALLFGMHSYNLALNRGRMKTPYKVSMGGNSLNIKLRKIIRGGNLIPKLLT
jgi:hypothetical protein